MADTSVLIAARDLTKVYAMGDQTVHALRGVSIDITTGTIATITAAINTVHERSDRERAGTDTA